MEEKRCPKCGKTDRQIRQGYTGSGSQRYLCRHCNYKYTPEKKSYSEEIKQLAIKTYLSGVSGRGVGKIFGISPPMVIRWIKKNGGSVDK